MNYSSKGSEKGGKKKRPGKSRVPSENFFARCKENEMINMSGINQRNFQYKVNAFFSDSIHPSVFKNFHIFDSTNEES